MKGFFKNKTIVVTGASSGIGYHTALKLTEMGAKLILVARRKEKLEQLQEKIVSNGGEALVFSVDVSSFIDVQDVMNKVIEHFGKIDILIANAGQYIQSKIVDAPIQLFEKSMTVNFYGTLNAIKNVLPSMIKERSGHIVIVNSLDAKKGIIGDGPYVSAKSALDGLGDLLRQEMNETGVEVTSIYPGRVDTEMIESLKVPGVSPKMHVDKVVNAIIKGIIRNKATVCVPGIHSSLGALNNLFPRFLDWFYAKYKLEGYWDS